MPPPTSPASPGGDLSFPQTMAVRTIERWLWSRFPEALPTPGRRSLQRVAEYPLVLPNGWPVPVHRLWPLLQAADPALVAEHEGETLVALRGDGFAFQVAPGWGTVQVVSGPCADLHTLRRLHEGAVARLVAAADTLGVLLLGLGIQPMTPAHPGLLTKLPRWQAPLESLGKPWLTLTLPAADQLQVELTRGELLEKLNLGGMVAPLIVALCANSPVYNMLDSYHCAGRDQVLHTIHPEHERFGFPGSPLGSLTERVVQVGRMPRLLTLDDQGSPAPTDPENPQSFLEFVEASPDVQANAGNLIGAYLMHEEQTWPSARANPLTSRLELSAADQQPWEDHMAACALNLGIVEAGMALHDFLFTAADPPRAPRVRPGIRQPPDPDRVPWDIWPQLVPFYAAAVARGLQAREPLTGMLEATLQHAHDALQRRGLGEEVYLAPLWDRLQTRENPAQSIRRVFHRQGIGGLLAARRIPPLA